MFKWSQEIPTDKRMMMVADTDTFFFSFFFSQFLCETLVVTVRRLVPRPVNKYDRSNGWISSLAALKVVISLLKWCSSRARLSFIVCTEDKNILRSMPDTNT